MRRSQAEKLQTHERILDAAARQIVRGGPESISISGLMKAANLTHGGFYKHFASRDALIEAAIRRATQEDTDPFGGAAPARSDVDGGLKPNDAAGDATDAVKAIVGRYLSRQHRDNLISGCALAALATDITRLEDAEAGIPVREKAERGFARMNAALGGGEDTEDDAMIAWCAMLGALTLARVFRGDARSDDILRLARRHILAMAERPVADAAGEGRG